MNHNLAVRVGIALLLLFVSIAVAMFSDWLLT